MRVVAVRWHRVTRPCADKRLCSSQWPNWIRRLTTNQEIGGSSPSWDIFLFGRCVLFFSMFAHRTLCRFGGHRALAPVGWPSGLRRQFQALVSSEAWVRIPLQSRFFFVLGSVVVPILGLI